MGLVIVFLMQNMNWSKSILNSIALLLLKIIAINLKWQFIS